MKRCSIVFYACFFFVACSDNGGNATENEDKYWEYNVFNDNSLICITEEVNPVLTIHEGFVSNKEDTVRIIRNGEAYGVARLCTPVIIAQADSEEIWGWFQFPGIFRNFDGNLICGWAMKPDSHTAFGDKTGGYCISKNEGESWDRTNAPVLIRGRYEVELDTGHILQVDNPAVTDITNYSHFPSPVNEKPILGYNFYYENDLPQELSGAYFLLWETQPGGAKSSLLHSVIEDPGLLRYSIDNLMPIEFWGDIKKSEEGFLIAGVYPCFYLNAEGNVERWAVSFYKSIDNGYHWRLLSKISTHHVFDGYEGYSEPTFERLKNGTLMCVMRTGSTTPMYKSFSEDNGEHWTEPEAFTPNGVKPFLFQLGNGVLVLTSGRPGVQIRFCLDGDGKIWTEPIDMMPFIDEDGNYDLWGITCGYTSVLKVDDNTFYLVYSNFKNKNNNGEDRKTIMFRKVQVFLKD